MPIQDLLVQIDEVIQTGNSSLTLKVDTERWYGVDDLTGAFSSIPNTVNTLKLYINEFENRTDAELAQVFPAIPKWITTIKLSYDYGSDKFEAKKNTKLQKILKVIPEWVTTLDLSDVNLGTPTQTADELVQTFELIPKTVKILDLTANNLSYQAGLSKVLAAIPKSVITLNLSGNQLGMMEDQELINALAAIPNSVTTLDLSGNNLVNKTTEQLIKIFAAIPKSVTTLNLSDNNLGNKTAENLIKIFAAIPESVTTLNLDNNNFLAKPVAELTKIFAAIPKSVTTLNLYDKKFDEKPVAELIQILAAIPSHVKIEGHFGMFYNKTSECLNYLISTTKEIEAKADPKNQLDLLKNVLKVIEPLYPDTREVLVLCDEVKTAILIMEGLSQVKAAEKLPNQGSSFSFQNISETNKLDTLLRTIDSAFEKISKVKSDSQLFAFSQETVLDLADQLYNQIPKDKNNESPEAKAKRLELCIKILKSDFIGNGNEKIIDKRDSLKTKIESEPNITSILQKK